MQIGSTFTFVAGNEGDQETVAAIVTGIWPDGTYEAYAFRHDTNCYIRSIAPNKCTEVTHLETFVQLQEQIAELRHELELLRMDLGEQSNETAA